MLHERYQGYTVGHAAGVDLATLLIGLTKGNHGLCLETCLYQASRHCLGAFLGKKRIADPSLLANPNTRTERTFRLASVQLIRSIVSVAEMPSTALPAAKGISGRPCDGAQRGSTSP